MHSPEAAARDAGRHRRASPPGSPDAALLETSRLVQRHREEVRRMRRDAAAIRLIEVDASVDLHHPERQGSFYIDVEGVDALYTSLKPALETLPEGRVRAPFDQPYGQREFHVSDEDCTLVFFGETLPRPQS